MNNKYYKNYHNTITKINAKEYLSNSNQNFKRIAPSYIEILCYNTSAIFVL